MIAVLLLFVSLKDLLNGTPLIAHAALYIVGSIICIVLIALTTRFQYEATYYTTYIESRVRRITLAEKIRLLPLSFFGKKDLVDLSNIIMSDCAILETAFSHFVPEVFGAMASSLLMSISLLFFNWKMGLAVLWVLPISFGIVLGSSFIKKKISQKAIEVNLDCEDEIQECIEIAQDLKANNAEANYLQRLDRQIFALEKRSVINEYIVSAFVVSAQLVLKLGIVTVVIIGSALLVKGALDVNVFFLFLLVASRIYDPLQISLEHLSAVMAIRVNIDLMNEIFEYPAQTGKKELSNDGTDLVFENVQFAYNPNEIVLKGLSFTAKQGEVTAIVGASGSGKTTVSKLAPRFWDVDKGKITVGRIDISQVDPETLLSLYSIVFQDVTLFNNSIMENIRIGRKDATDEEVLAANEMANCDVFANVLPEKYKSIIGENGCELSGGERQRISISRAFLKDSPIILLDEATASLDVENERLIQEALSKLIKNKAVIVIAHRMRTVLNADQIVVLSEGKLVESGAPEDLLKEKGVFSHMVELQSAEEKWVL